MREGVGALPAPISFFQQRLFANEGEGEKALTFCKTRVRLKGNSERSEESRIFNALKSFTSFRMTEKPVLQ
jgi:hypothetical protein